MSCCAWLKEQSEAQGKQDWTRHRQAACTPEWWCWSCTTEPTTPVILNSELSQYRGRGCCGTVDGHHRQTRVSGAALREQQRPQYGTTEQGSWGAALSEATVGQDQPGTEPSAGTWQLQSRAAQEKHILGSHRLLETMRQCHLPAGAAGTFRMHQMLRRTSRDVNGSGEKSMQKVTPKISSSEWQSNQRGFPWASTNSLSPASGQTARQSPCPGQGGFAEEPTVVKKTLNSSRVFPAVWLVETFSATKALTPREST